MASDRLTAGEVAQLALSDMDVEVSHLVGVRWVEARYRELAGTVKLNHLRRIGEIVVPAAISSGTVAVTQGSTLVTGDVTAAAAWAGDRRGWYFRADDVWHEIENVNGTTLTLASPYSEDTNAAATYHLVQRFVSLPSGLSDVDPVFVHPRTGTALQRYSMQEMNTTFPRRDIVGSSPKVWSEATIDTQNEQRRIEIYPYPDADPELFAYMYWVQPLSIRHDTMIPADVDPYRLKEGVLIDVMRHKSNKLLREGDVQGATLLRNDYRAQETRWKEVKGQIARAVRSTEDASIILRSRYQGTVEPLPTAYNHVWNV